MKVVPVKPPRPADWSELGIKHGAVMCSVEASLESMRRADYRAKAAIEKAVALLAESPLRPQRAKDALQKAYAEVNAEFCRAAGCATSTVYAFVPLLVDESSPETRAHHVARAHDEEHIRLGRMRISLQRTTFGDGAQVSCAIAEALKFWTVEAPPVPVVVVPMHVVLPEAPTVSEPLMAVAETGATYGTGACACDHGLDRTIPPSMIQFDRQVPAADGAMTLVRESSVSVSSEMTQAFLDRRACLPWVRVTRDPQKFGRCAKMAQKIGRVDGAQKVYDLLCPRGVDERGDPLWSLANEDQEVFIVILLDVQLHVRALSEIARGARDRSEVPIPDVLRIALVEGATTVVVVHNHPSGVVEPSESDKRLTQELKRAFSTVHIALLDHVIVGREKFWSFADHKML